MSKEYDLYLGKHKQNVAKGYEWMRTNVPQIFEDCTDVEWGVVFNHDSSKTNDDEYKAYDAYFYGGNRSFDVVKNFNKAWLFHIHRNPHHWQYWVLMNDEPGKKEEAIETPLNYIIEMICDWWSFSWASGELTEIFEWYEKHQDYIKLHFKTRKKIRYIFGEMKKILQKGDADEW